MDRRELLRGLGGLGLLAALAGCAQTYSALRLTIATGGVGGEYNPLGMALAAAWREELQLDTMPEVRVSEGSLDNIQQLTSHDVDVAFSQLDVATDAFRRDPTSLCALARIYDDVVHVVVPRGSPIRSVTQLRGHTVAVGGRTSGVLFIVRRLLPAIGLSTEDLLPVYEGLTESVQALRSGRIDAFIWVGGLPTPGITDLAKSKAISLVDMKDIAKQVQQKFPAYSPRPIVAGTYTGVDEALTTLAVRNVLAVRRDMGDSLAHDLVKALFERQSEIARPNTPALTIDPRRAIGTVPVDLHPGAAQWFREARESG